MGNAMTNYYIFFYVIIIVTFIAIIFHCIGLLAIHLHTKKVNQNIILASLSIAEIIASIQRIIFDIFVETKIVRENGYSMLLLAERVIYYIGHYQVLSMMFILTADRLVCVLDPLKYKSRMTRKKTKITMSASWVITVLMGVGIGASPMPLRNQLNGIPLIAMPLYIVFVLVIYIVIVERVSRRSKLSLSKIITQAAAKKSNS